jgi:hypothetical protein
VPVLWLPRTKTLAAGEAARAIPPAILRLVDTPTNPGAIGGVEEDDDEPATGVETTFLLADPVPFVFAGVRNGLAGVVEEEVVPVGGVATTVACLVTFPPADFFLGGAVDVAELDEDLAEVGLALTGGVALVAFLLTLLLTGGVALALLLTGGVS